MASGVKERDEEADDIELLYPRLHASFLATSAFSSFKKPFSSPTPILREPIRPSYTGPDRLFGGQRAEAEAEAEAALKAVRQLPMVGSRSCKYERRGDGTWETSGFLQQANLKVSMRFAPGSRIRHFGEL